MPGVLLWGWDNTNKKWVPVLVNASGKLELASLEDAEISQATPQDMKHVPHGYYAAGPSYLPLKVKGDGTLCVDIASMAHLNDIADVSVASPTDGYVLYWDNATSSWKCKAPTFLDLSDTPSTYTDQAGKVASVKSTEDGLEFTVPDLYALTRLLRASRYHMFPLGTNINYLPTPNRLYAIPFLTPVARTVTRMAIHVTGASAGNARLGIYQDDGSIYPGSLVADAGIVSTSTTGLKEITGLNISLLANTLYWTVFDTNASAASIASLAAGTGWSLLGYDTSLAVAGSGYWLVEYAYNALPATFPANADAINTNILKIALYF